MTRALVTQLLNALEYHQSQTRPIHNTELAIESAREYLATEPSGERAELIERLRDYEEYDNNKQAMSDAADMLEADASLQTQLARRTVERDMAISMLSDALEADVQQAKRVPLTDDQIQEIYIHTYTAVDHGRDFENAFARAIEAHHGITPAVKPTGDEPEDLYALALKADNWGQP